MLGVEEAESGEEQAENGRERPRRNRKVTYRIKGKNLAKESAYSSGLACAQPSGEGQEAIDKAYGLQKLQQIRGAWKFRHGVDNWRCRSAQKRDLEKPKLELRL